MTVRQPQGGARQQLSIPQEERMTELDLSLAALRGAYADGSLSPGRVLAAVRRRAADYSEHKVWIHLLSESEQAPYLATLQGKDPSTLPLYGIPFAIKDNIDLAGIPTTAGCPDYAYVPEQSAFVVRKLIEAGAVPVGKTNLDQFATGLVGTRSPYGACRNAFDPAYISGGSSSGSAVAVALGMASFALGTDTAGSGRVPAAFNNLLGVKPTRGLLSASGVVPACRTLDTASLFALNPDDAAQLLEITAVYDPADAYARPATPMPASGAERFRFGVPRADQLAFFGNRDAECLYRDAVARLEAAGGEAISIDFAPFLAAARLLYEGPWVAERYAAIQDFIEHQPDSVFPVTREITLGGRAASAVDAFKAQYRLAELKRQADTVLAEVEFIVTPSAGTIYTVAQVDADPVRLNSTLGYYTNFMNLLDYAALAVPAGFQDDGLPFGVTLFGPAFSDPLLLDYGRRLVAAQDLPMGASERHWQPRPRPPEARSDRVRVVVCGAHLSGLPLNGQLTERGGRLLEATRTAPCYRFYALAGGPPLRPGVVRDEAGGAAIEVEVWELPMQQFGSFVAGIPAPLGIGSVQLADGRWEKGFICEPHGVIGAEEITGLGGWRAYLARRSA